MCMVISDTIEDAIVEFKVAHGCAPTRLILGKLQLAALKEFAERYSMGPDPIGRPSFESSDGVRLPIDESPLNDELTLI
jgi:hypothetical protein